jgi:hypothetical protein
MKMVVDINPAYEFQSEIDCMQNTLHQEILLRALRHVPSYFYTTPASTSGKYHPRGDLGIGGTLRHTKAVFWLGEELLSHRLYAPFDDVTKDDIRVALLLHDAVKLGTGEDQTHTVPNHPLLVRETLHPWKGTSDVIPEGMEQAWDRICNLIETHMGIWTKDREGREILCEPETCAQKFVHMCDYIASRKIVEIDVTQRVSATTNNSTNWRDLPAKDTQVSFIKSLWVQCINAGIKYTPVQLIDPTGAIIIKRGVASDLIQELKKTVGME